MKTIEKIINQCSKEQAEIIFLRLDEVMEIIEKVGNKDFLELMSDKEFYFLFSIKSIAFHKFTDETTKH